MESSFDRTNESLNPQSPLKVDDKQNLFVNTLVVSTVENIIESSGLGLNYTAQSAVDKWAGKQAADLSSLVGNPIVRNNSVKSAPISVVQAYRPLVPTIAVLPVVVNKPANIAPTGLIISGVKPSYDMGSTLSINPSFIMDGNGWKDISKVDFWLMDSKNKRVELADVTSFVAKDPKDNNSAKFDYTTSLKGIPAGDYKLVAVAYDKFGVASNQFTQAISIKVVYQIGFDGTKTDAAFVNTFNKLNGVQILGKATNNISSITGGKVQNFEKGSIFQSTAGTFSLQGTLNNYYNALSATDKLKLGLPIANETSARGYWYQSFQNGELQLVQGMPVKWSDQSLIKDRFNLLGGATTLGKSIGTIRDLNGGKVQDFERGSIFAYGNKTVAVTGSISTYYRANNAVLGLPVSEEITTGFGKRQDFSNGKTLINSAQFGTQVLQGSLGAYYRGLSEAQRNQLGAAYTGENDLSGGNWRQFFRGGTVEWKNNGTGEIKLTPFTIGFNGSAINTAFTTKFNAVVGWDALGKATGNVRSIAGGTVQDFEKGSIFQSAKGTFILDGILSEMYRQEYSSISFPIGDKVLTVNGIRQDFENGTLVNTPTGSTFVIKGAIASYYKGLNDTQLKALGSPINNANTSNTGTSQYFQNAVMFSSSFGTFTVRGVFSERATSRGVPIGEEKVAGDGLRQDFSEGSATYSDKAGIHEITGDLVKYYQSLSEAQKAQLGVAYTNTVSGGNNSFQFFQGGVIELNRNGANQIRFTPAIGFDGNTFNQKFFEKFMSMGNFDGLGDPITNVFVANGILRQDFTKGFITQNGSLVEGKPYGGTITITNDPPITSGGTIIIIGNQNPSFSVNGGGSIGNFYNKIITADQRQYLGQPKNNEFKAGGSLEWKQDFQTGSIFHGVNGTFIVQNSLLNTYNGLSDGDKQRLGMPIGSETNAGGYWHQSFKNGELQLGQNTPVKWNDGGSPPVQTPVQQNKFKESVEINTEWLGTVFKWDPSSGQPPANFYDGGYDSSNAIAEINLGSNNLGNGKQGIKFDIGQGALKEYNDRLPSDSFAVRAYTQASFDGGEYKFQVRGDDGFQIFAKNIVTNEWVYVTPQDQWQSSYGNYQEVTKTLPQGRYDLHFHYFEGGGNAYLDLAWDKVSKATPVSNGLPTNTQQADQFFKTQFLNSNYNPNGPNGSYNCGPTSLAMILKMLGKEPSNISVETSIDRARYLMIGFATGTREGVSVRNDDYSFTNTDDIARGIRQSGGTPDYTTTLDWNWVDNNLNAGNPIIMSGFYSTNWRYQFPSSDFMDKGQVEHINSILGRTSDGKYIIADPLSIDGTVLMNRNQISIFFNTLTKKGEENGSMTAFKR